MKIIPKFQRWCVRSRKNGQTSGFEGIWQESNCGDHRTRSGHEFTIYPRTTWYWHASWEKGKLEKMPWSMFWWGTLDPAIVLDSQVWSLEAPLDNIEELKDLLLTSCCQVKGAFAAKIKTIQLPLEESPWKRYWAANTKERFRRRASEGLSSK